MQNLKEFREAGAKRFQKKEIAAALGITEPTSMGLSLPMYNFTYHFRKENFSF